MAETKRDLIVMPREASHAMMDAAVEAARAQQPNRDGLVGYRQMRAAYDAFVAAWHAELANNGPVP